MMSVNDVGAIRSFPTLTAATKRQNLKEFSERHTVSFWETFRIRQASSFNPPHSIP
jgi:hypothetical protein